MTKATAKKKTMLVERDRTHYARAHGDLERVRIDAPLAVDLEVPTSYARDLLHALQRVIAAGGDFEQAEIVVDLPVRIYLRPLAVEQLIAKLVELP
jgi:hypothetical protein